MSGSGRAHIAIGIEETLKEAFIKDIKAFESGQFPKEADFVKSDKDLNKLYTQIMKLYKSGDYGDISKESIQATQQKWIKYRDAWIKFIESRYPKYSPEAWKTRLTKKRIKQLRKFQ